MQPIIKILNSSFIRQMCHSRDVKVSEEAIQEMASRIFDVWIEVIEETKREDRKTVLRRYVERRF